MKSSVSRILVGLGLVVSVFAGVQMIALESEAGNTVAESFYNHMGWLGIGVALLLLAVFVSLETMRGSQHSFVGAAVQCPTCHQVISQRAEMCPYCHVRLGKQTTSN